MTTPVEYEATLSGVALMQRPWRALVSVEGGARSEFLQGMLSNEIQAVTAGGGCRALLLDNKGKVHGDLDLWAESERILVACDAAAVQHVLDSLRKYVLATPVQFLQLGDDVRFLGLVGPEAEDVLKEAGVEVPPSIPYAHVGASLAGVEVRLARTPALAAEGFEIHASREAYGEVIAMLHKAAGGTLPEVDEQTAEILRVEAGLPRQGFELTGEQFPQEARLDDAISYEKGCYLGQETVARIHYRGNVNRILAGWRSPEPVTLGSDLFHQGREVGVVTSSVISPRFGPIGLGYVRRDLDDPGTRLELQVEDGGSPRIQLSDLPFQQDGE